MPQPGPAPENPWLECRKQMVNVVKNWSVNDKYDDEKAAYDNDNGGPIFDEGHEGDDEDVICGDGRLSLLIGRNLMTPRVLLDDKWSCHCVLHTTWTVEKHRCQIIICSGNCENWERTANLWWWIN